MKIVSVVGARPQFIKTEAARHFQPRGELRDLFGVGRAAEKTVEVMASA